MFLEGRDVLGAARVAKHPARPHKMAGVPYGTCEAPRKTCAHCRRSARRSGGSRLASWTRITGYLAGWRHGERADDGGRSAGDQARAPRTGRWSARTRDCGTAHVWRLTAGRGPCGLVWCDDRDHGVRCRSGRRGRRRRWSWCRGRRCPSPAGRAARGAGPGERGVGAAGQRQDGAAAVLDQPVGRGERDPQRFWLSVLAALRQTAAGSALVRELTAAPDLNGWAITERLLADLAPLDDRLWLVIDDVHELGADALRQLELLILRAPPLLRFVLATRHDVRLGLHRLRLEGELAEIRGPDLRFTAAEAAELLDAAGVDLPEVAPLVA